MNVNLFWVRPAREELELLVTLLAPGGRLCLVYEPPTAEGLRSWEAMLVEHLAAAGFRCSTRTGGSTEARLLAVTARLRR